MQKLKVVELFAGIGAWSKALERLNIDHEIVCAAEIDKKTMDSYNIIHNTRFETSDIENLISLAFLKLIECTRLNF